ncbi:MAG: response regulator receiver protein [Myxococcales bacterium]|nr:response regulator receiver protein [Myxococcales bacterium]
MSESLSRQLSARLPSETTTVVQSAEAFLGAQLDAQLDSKTVSFVDSSTIAELEGTELSGNVIAVCDGTLQSSIGWLPTRPWLSHVLSASMLDHPLATEHLTNVINTLTGGERPRLLDWLGPTMSGRRVRLAQASRRVERLERMSDFLDSKGVGARTIEHLRDAAEELLTNAFYDAPVSAGAVDHPISRTQDVTLPDDDACDLVYGCRDDLAIVRLRDPFGSLTRTRLVEVLTRCARTDMQVEVDESMGGAGLGLWRIFSAASFVAISVVSGRHTEFLVGIAKKSPGPRPFAFHLFFRDGKKRRRLVETSVTIAPDKADL